MPTRTIRESDWGYPNLTHDEFYQIAALIDADAGLVAALHEAALDLAERDRVDDMNAPHHVPEAIHRIAPLIWDVTSRADARYLSIRVGVRYLVEKGWL